MRFGRQEIGSVAGAVALHAAALLLLGVTVDDGGSVANSGVRPPDELSLEVDLEHASVAEEATEVDAVASGAHVARVGRSVAELREPRAPEPASEAPAAETSELLADGNEPDGVRSEPLPSQGPIDLGIGADGWQRWVTPSKAGEIARAEVRPPRTNRFHVLRAPPVSTTGGLQEGLEQRDRELGLGPSGRVISVLHKVGHSEAAPVLGAARFDVTVLRSGAVEVTLGASSGDAEKWRKVADQIAGELRAKPPRIRPPREGMRLKVELVAEETMPSGTKANSRERAHLEAPPLKFKSTEQAKAQLQADNPTTETPNADSLTATNLDQPGVYLADRGKLGDFRAGIAVLPPGAQSYGEGVTPLGLSAQGHIDPSGIGAKPQRMVRARVIEQTMF